MKIELIGKLNTIYEEIAAEYERYIRIGALKEGDKLPSVRELAMQVGVNPNTVVHAYILMEERGLIRILPKKGAFVRAYETPPRIDEARSRIARLKEAGVTKEEILSVVEELYGEGGKND